MLDVDTQELIKSKLLNVRNVVQKQNLYFWSETKLLLTFYSVFEAQTEPKYEKKKFFCIVSNQMVITSLISSFSNIDFKISPILSTLWGPTSTQIQSFYP